jgi:hypothetical protein
MKSAKLLWTNTRNLTVIVVLLASLAGTAVAQAPGDQKPGEWKAVEDVFGFPPANLPGGMARFNMPRKDLHVTLGGVEVKPGLALGAANFTMHAGVGLPDRGGSGPTVRLYRQRAGRSAR